MPPTTETIAPTVGTSSLRYLTIEQVALVRPAFTHAALRDLKFKANDRTNSRGDIIRGNGTGKAGVWIQLGRKVLVDLDRFDTWLDSHRTGGGHE